MKGIASTGDSKTLLGGWVDGWMDGWMDGWVDGWMEGKAGLRIAYSNQKHLFALITNPTVLFLGTRIVQLLLFWEMSMYFAMNRVLAMN
jgi:hypothetical protein